MGRYLIVNADDFGMCEAANDAVIRLFEAGRLHSSTIMFPCPASGRAARFAAEHPEYAIGVHLTLTSEWKTFRWKPLTGGATLLDEEGYLWRRTEDVEKNASYADILAEIEAQLQAALDSGMKPSHLDNHMGTLYGNRTGRFGLLMLALKIFRVKTRAKYYAYLSWLVAGAGVVGLVVAFVNAVMFVTGKTAGSFGHWLVLHHIGFAGLIALPFALLQGKRGHWLRLVSGCAILLLYTLFHEGDLANDLFNSNRELIDEVADGGFIGGFAFGAMLILYLFFAEEFRRRRNKYLPPLSFCVFAALTAALIAAELFTLPEGTETWAGALSTFLPINKGSESPSYVIITGFISLLAFYIIDLFNGFTPAFDPAAWWGKNPILLYCVEFAVIGGLNAALEDTFKTFSMPAAAATVIAVAVLLTVLAYILHKKDIVVKL